MEQQMKSVIAFVSTRKWAWVLFKYLVLPVFAVYEICKDRLPAIVVEYHKDVLETEATIAACRASNK
jgi:hypothetical protein